MDSDKEFVEKLLEQQSLDLFKIGCDRKNFAMLSDIKAGKFNVQQLIKAYGLSSMPGNRRINLMVNVGLVQRVNKKRDVKLTDLGDKFIGLISKIQTYLKENVLSNLENCKLVMRR